MIVSFVVPLLATAAFGLAAPWAGRRLDARLAVWLLSAGGWLLTAVCGTALVLVAVAGLGQLPRVAALGRWSPQAMAAGNPYAPWAGVLAGTVLLVAGAGGLLAAARGARRLRRAWGAAAAAAADLVVCDDPHPVAYAVPGWPGRIVVSRALLRSLDARGRRVLLAHEQAHLDGRDDLVLFAAAVCAGLNPLLGRTPAALADACERRADDAAARVTGDRRLVAETIATAARPVLPAAALLAAGGDVADRVEALLSPTRRGLGTACTVLGAVMAAGLSLLWLAHDLDAVTDGAALRAALRSGAGAVPSARHVATHAGSLVRAATTRRTA